MSAVPASIKAAIEPQVNLLPPEVAARRARGRKKGLIAFAFAAFVLALGAAVFWAYSQDAAAKRELQASVDKGVTIQAEIDVYAPVLALEAELANARNARTYVGSTEVDVGRLIAAIGAGFPSGVTIEALALSTVSIVDPGGVAVDSLGIPDIGELTISGRVPMYVTAADLEEALNAVPGLARATITSVQKQGEGGGTYYVYAGSVRVTALALSGHFSSAWLVRDAIDRAVEAAETRRKGAIDALAAADAAVEAGVAGAADARAAAEAVLSVAQSDYLMVHGLYTEVVDAERNVLDLKQAVAYGGAGAADSLALAEANLAELRTALDPLAAAMNAWDSASRGLATVEARIVAAGEYVTLREGRVADAEAAVVAGDVGAERALTDARAGLSKAQYNLGVEQSFLAAAQTSEATTRTAFDALLAETSVGGES